MQALQIAAAQPGIIRLIDRLYPTREVEGFALGVHGEFVSLYQSEFDRRAPINRLLVEGKAPSGWADVCQRSGIEKELSPIYVVVYVNVSEETFRKSFEVPRLTEVGGHAIFIETIEPFVANADRGRHRPVLGGISVGSWTKRTLAGTLGGFLEDAAGGSKYLASCAHVLGNINDSVVQQGPADGGGHPVDTIGMTAFAVPLTPPAGFTPIAPYNDTDAALAELQSSVVVTMTIRRLGPVTGVVPASGLSLGDEVVFVGKESDYQQAYVHHFIARAKVKIDGVVYNFGNIFEIRPRTPLYLGSLSRNGDSGAWVIRDGGTRADQVAGILFAGNNKASFCCYMETAISALEKQAGRRFRVAR